MKKISDIQKLFAQAITGSIIIVLSALYFPVVTSVVKAVLISIMLFSIMGEIVEGISGIVRYVALAELLTIEEKKGKEWHEEQFTEIENNMQIVIVGFIFSILLYII